MYLWLRWSGCAAGSLGSAARQPGAGMILFTGLSICIRSAVRGLSENSNIIVDPVHNSGAVLGDVALTRQLSSIEDNGSFVFAHNIRKGELKTNSHGATARALRHARSPQRVFRASHDATATALRHARSPQRVRRAQDTFARRHSERASARTLSAEGLP